MEVNLSEPSVETSPGCPARGLSINVVYKKLLYFIVRHRKIQQNIDVQEWSARCVNFGSIDTALDGERLRGALCRPISEADLSSDPLSGDMERLRQLLPYHQTTGTISWSAWTALLNLSSRRHTTAIAEVVSEDEVY